MHIVILINSKTKKTVVYIFVHQILFYLNTITCGNTTGGWMRVGWVTSVFPFSDESVWLFVAIFVYTGGGMSYIILLY